jgi:hypothetical protein
VASLAERGASGAPTRPPKFKGQQKEHFKLKKKRFPAFNNFYNIAKK